MIKVIKVGWGVVGACTRMGAMNVCKAFLSTKVNRTETIDDVDPDVRV